MSWRANIRDEIRAMTPPQRRAATAVWLDANESPYALDEAAAAALARHLATVPLNRYPESSGEALRRLVGEQLGVAEVAVSRVFRCSVWPRCRFAGEGRNHEIDELPPRH
jgi:histidinol-phosphate/aromatic aminotransferase/cobyric acid decarboxylase-like protein